MEIIREHQIRFLMCDSFRSCWVFIVFSFIKLRLSRAFSDRLISAMRFRIPLTMLSFLAGGSIMVLELLRIARVLLGTIGFRCWLDRSTDEVRSGLWFWCVTVCTGWCDYCRVSGLLVAVWSLYYLSHSSSVSSIMINRSRPSPFISSAGSNGLLECTPTWVLDTLLFSLDYLLTYLYFLGSGGDGMGVLTCLSNDLFSSFLASRYSISSSEVFPEWEVSLGWCIIVGSCFMPPLVENGILRILSFCLNIFSESRFTLAVS